MEALAGALGGGRGGGARARGGAEERAPRGGGERSAFDNADGASIAAEGDVGALRRMEWYFRTEGYPGAADAAAARLRELGARTFGDDDRAAAEEAAAGLREFRGGLASWSESLDALASVDGGARSSPSAPPRGTAGARPGVRGRARGEEGHPGIQPYSGGEEPRREPDARERAWRAVREKEKGNEAFRCGDAAQAVEHYTAALELGPSVALRANRAAAHLKLKQWDACIDDCTHALREDPGHVKALVRRAAARVEVKRFDGALEDVESALEISPGSRSVTELRERILRLMPQKGAKITIEEEDSDSEGEAQETHNEVAGAEHPAGQRWTGASAGAGARTASEAPEAVMQTRVERRVLDKTDHGNGVFIEEFTEEEVEFTPSPSDVAQGLKERGNALFKAGHLAGALRLYDESLAACLDPAVHANRALALLGLDKFAAAEAACDAALASDPGNVKALHRRGVARRRLGKLEDALADYRMVTAQLSGNQKVDSELAELLAEAEAKRKQQAAEKVVAEDAEEAAKATAPSPEAQTKVVIIEETDSESENAGGGGREETELPSGPVAVQIAEVTDDESDGDTDWEVVPPTPPGSRLAAAATAAAEMRGVLGFESPKTSADFEKALRALAKSREDLGRYLSLVDPGTYPELLKSSLTPEIVAHVLQGLPASCHWEGGPETAAEALRRLAAVPRFDINIMLVPSRQKAAVAEAFRALEGGLKPDSLQALKQKYRI